MSKRRRPGQRVWKISNAGFVGAPGYGYIPLEATPDPALCCDCGDDDCQEWDLWMESGSVCCHVAECEMLDTKPEGDL